MKKILTVNCRIPGDFGQYVSFHSRQSLLDADFVVICPDQADFHSIIKHSGKPLINDADSYSIKESTLHWTTELEAILQAGNTVFVLLSDRKDFYLSDYTSYWNYAWMPFYRINIRESRGKEMVLHEKGAFLKEYWSKYGHESEYRLHFEDEANSVPLVTTRSGKRPVGAMWRSNEGGTLIALPWINFDRQEFSPQVSRGRDGHLGMAWPQVAIDWGREFQQTLSSLDDIIKGPREGTPIPQWAKDTMFKTIKEKELSQELLDIENKMTNLQKQREDATVRLKEEGVLRRLLYDQGHSLEEAILEAMRLLGFKASHYRDSNSEFDAVLESPEGRLIGEAEGRNNRAIAIGKMRQLESNIHEDFERDEVSEIATGILFGNAHRLIPPSERPLDHFTDKCKQAAGRTKTVLVRTCDLFGVAKALADKPDPEFARACRKAIFAAAGEEVTFPDPPRSTDEKG